MNHLCATSLVAPSNFDRIAVVNRGVVFAALGEPHAATIPEINGWDYG
jgi:Skp family chaperone for outer membrane proteins